MSYVVNNHLNDIYVLSNKAVGPTFIPESRVGQKSLKKIRWFFGPNDDTKN